MKPRGQTPVLGGFRDQGLCGCTWVGTLLPPLSPFCPCSPPHSRPSPRLSPQLQLLAGSQHCSCPAPCSPPPSLPALQAAGCPWAPACLVPVSLGLGAGWDQDCWSPALLPPHAPSTDREGWGASVMVTQGGPQLFLMPPAHKINIPPPPPSCPDRVPPLPFTQAPQTGLASKFFHSHALLVGPPWPWTPSRETARPQIP